MGILSKIFSNTRKPEGFFGRIMVAGMNGGGHATMANWGMDLVSAPQQGKILDIGCGGGGNIQRLLRRSANGMVEGVDYSPVSVKKSTKVNAEAIKNGRSWVQEANVASLPFDDETFDMVTAFETIYFWPEIKNSFGEVLRVMKHGATFLVVNEDDGLSGNNEKWEKLIEGMHTYTPDELTKLLAATGFRNITVHRKENNHWLAVTAMK